MNKVSSQNFYIPVVQPLEAGKILSSGRTKPMIIRGVCEQNGERGEYVVKLNGSPEMFPGSALREIIASLLAIELELPVPKPAIIHITTAFVETMSGKHLNYDLAKQSIGLNFGTVYMPDFIEILPGQVIDSALKAQLADLLAFDILIGNPDRRVDKHNFHTDGKNLLIFDHEIAFSFTDILFAKNPKPWLILPSDLEWLKNNYCFQQLKGNIFDFSKFTNRLNSITDDVWDKMEELIPEEWLNEKFTAIKEHVNQVVQNNEEFSSELNRILL